MNASQHDLKAGDIASLLADRIVDLVRELLPNGHREGAEWRCGNVRGEAGKSLGVHLGGAKAGIWCDFGTGEAGDALDLAQAVKGLPTKSEAIAWAKSWLGMEGSEPAERRARAPDRSRAQRQHQPHGRDGADQRCELARRIWRESRPALGTPVTTYLKGRGITTPPPPSLRYHGALRHSPTNLDLPAMIAAVQAPDRSLIGVHRTYLTMDGTNKAPVSSAKMMLGRCAGGAVRLARANGRLAVCEGIETALSVQQETGIPTWAALSAPGMTALILPPDIRDVTLAPDGDEAGERAAREAAKRFVREGRRVHIARPPHGADFNDVLSSESETR